MESGCRVRTRGCEEKAGSLYYITVNQSVLNSDRTKLCGHDRKGGNLPEKRLRIETIICPWEYLSRGGEDAA